MKEDNTKLWKDKILNENNSKKILEKEPFEKASEIFENDDLSWDEKCDKLEKLLDPILFGAIKNSNYECKKKIWSWLNNYSNSLIDFLEEVDKESEKFCNLKIKRYKNEQNLPMLIFYNAPQREDKKEVIKGKDCFSRNDTLIKLEKIVDYIKNRRFPDSEIVDNVTVALDIPFNQITEINNTELENMLIKKEKNEVKDILSEKGIELKDNFEISNISKSKWYLKSKGRYIKYKIEKENEKLKIFEIADYAGGWAGTPDEYPNGLVIIDRNNLWKRSNDIKKEPDIKTRKILTHEFSHVVVDFWEKRFDYYKKRLDVFKWEEISETLAELTSLMRGGAIDYQESCENGGDIGGYYKHVFRSAEPRALVQDIHGGEALEKLTKNDYQGLAILDWEILTEGIEVGENGIITSQEKIGEILDEKIEETILWKFYVEMEKDERDNYIDENKKKYREEHRKRWGKEIMEIASQKEISRVDR